MWGKPVLETQPTVNKNLRIVGKLFFIKTHREKIDESKEKSGLIYSGGRFGPM